MEMSVRLGDLSALHSWLFAAASCDQINTVFWQVVESGREMEFDCDKT
jgi:hypothetical protein